MYKIILLTTMLLLSINVFSQNKKIKHPIKSKIDTTMILKKMVKKYWIYNKEGDFIRDSFGLFWYDTLYTPFKKLLIGKTKNEILKLLGKTGYISSDKSYNSISYNLKRVSYPVICYDVIHIYFDKKWRVNDMLHGECNSSH